MECKVCHKKFQYLLIHLYRNNSSYNCRQDYTEKQLSEMKKKAKTTTTTNTNKKRQSTYDKSKRRERYLYEKSTTKQGKHKILPLKMACKNSYNLLEYTMLKGFSRFQALVNKEIKRNNSSLLPPLQQK